MRFECDEPMGWLIAAVAFLGFGLVGTLVAMLAWALTR